MAVAPTQDVKVWKNYIGGEWVDAASGETFEVINPSSGEVVGAAPKGGREDAQAAIGAARDAFDRRDSLRKALGPSLLAALKPLLPFSRNDLWEVEELRERLPSRTRVDHPIRS